MRRVGLVIVILATVLLIYHGYLRNAVFLSSIFDQTSSPGFLTGNILQKTTDLVLTDIGLQLLGITLISMDRRETFARRQE
jgi:hypothetical protein